MKIAFVNNFFNAGGSTKTAYALAQNFSKNHEMQFYGFFDGIYRERFESLGKTTLLNSTNFDYDDGLIEYINGFNPNIIHVFIPGSQNPTYFNKLPKTSKKFATILCEQRISFDTTIFDKIFFQSKYGERYTGPVSNGVVIRPGYDYDFLEKAQSKEPVLARVSAFCPSKMIDHTVLACARHKHLKTNVVGEIQDINYYKKILDMKSVLDLKNLKIQANVNDQIVEDTINNCDIWHYPTSSEVFCFSVLEAMAAKKPVISYKKDAVCELFDSDEWLADNMEDMFEKTSRMIKTSSEERTKIGRKNYLMYLKHGADLFADKIMAEYLKVSNQSN